MEPLAHIDALQPGRPELSIAERWRDRQLERDRDQEAGYDQLTALCQLGEPEMAARLARQNPQWGYQVVNGTVMVQE
jgi:hypothetical protein